MLCKYMFTQNTELTEVQCTFCLTATLQNWIHGANPDHSFLAYQMEWYIYKTTVSHSHMSGMCAHAQVPTSPTFGCKSRCSQACIKLSTIPSPNKPASTVSVTTRETLDKKNMMYNKHFCQQSIILLKKNPHHTNMSSEQNFYQEFQYMWTI